MRGGSEGGGSPPHYWQEPPLVAARSSRSPPAEPLYQVISRLRPLDVRAGLCDVAAISAREVLAVVETTQMDADNQRWLRAAIGQMGAEQLRDLLFFSTGARCLPSSRTLGGTGSRLYFQRVAASNEHLPVSHTCANRIDMPVYNDSEQLRTKLGQAIAICCQQGGGFQFG